MKSPFTGGEVVLKSEIRKAKFRGKEYEYTSEFYECVDTKAMFTTTEMDEVNIGQIYNQYRVENRIPFPDEIRKLRESCGISARLMSKLLGFGENQYRLYEKGEIPNISNGRLLRCLIENPHAIMSFAQSARNELGERNYDKILKFIEEFAL